MKCTEQNKDFFYELQTMLSAGKTPGIALPHNVSSIIEERNSLWTYDITIQNNTLSAKNVAIFTGNTNTERVAIADANGDIIGLGGQLLDFDAYGVSITPGLVLTSKDNPLSLNAYAGESIDAVATQSISEMYGKLTQEIYKNAEGSIVCSSRAFSIDFMRNFISRNPVRMFEIQITATKPELAFNGFINIKEVNPFTGSAIPVGALSLQDAYRPTNAVKNKVVISQAFFIGAETFMGINVPGESSLTLSMQFSAYHSVLQLIKKLLNTDSLLAELKKQLITH